MLRVTMLPLDVYPSTFVRTCTTSGGDKRDWCISSVAA